MEAYLSTTLEKLKSNNFSDLNIVLGNESCDLDSAVSALVYAAFLHYQYLQIKCKVCTQIHRAENVSKDDIFVPIMNVDRHDYSLKTEVAFCFREHGIDEDMLVFRDDLDLQNLVTTRKSNIILVDHHILGKRDRFLTPYVTEIVDHRPIQKAEWKYKEGTRSTIETVGSCATLVAQRIRNLSALIAKDEDFFVTHPVCTDLLHSAIVLDTVNFSKEVDKATPQDIEMAAFLESILAPLHVEENRKCKLERLVEARKDVSTLTPAQLLRKDVKIFGEVLVPSFPILVEEYLEKPEVLTAVAQGLAQKDCSVALLLGMNLSGGLQRDAAVYCPENPAKAVALAKFLQQWTTPPLQLEEQDLSKFPQDVATSSLIYMKQKHLSASRKQYIPAIQEFLLKYKPATDEN